MKPHYDQMEGEIADETSTTFLNSNKIIHLSTDVTDKQNITKSSRDRPHIAMTISNPNNIEQAISISTHDMNDESNQSTDNNYNNDDETAQLKDESPQMSVTDETKGDDSDSDDEALAGIQLGFAGQMYRNISDGTWTIDSVLKIMGKIYIHQDDMFQKSPHQISQNGQDCNHETKKIVRYSELPAWYRFNLWIIHGYRNCECYNTTECVKSIIQKHNECGNIWTEFIPGFIFISIFMYQLLYNPSWILYAFNQDGHHDCDLFTRYAICYWINFMIILIRPFISGCAHWFHPISRNSYNRWWKADYISIVWATMASASNFAVCEFFCNFAAFGAILFLLVAISAILTVVIAGSNANENTGIKEKAMVLMLCFEFWGSFIYSASVLFHSWRTNNEVWENEDHFGYYLFWFLSVISSLIAAVFRVTQIPERCVFKSILKEIIENDGGDWKEYKKVMRNADCAQEVNQEQKRKLLKLSKYSKAAMERDHCAYYYFTSHQWWHIFVNLSVAFQMYAWVQYFRYREALINPCC